jgi:hypothetical protein
MEEPRSRIVGEEPDCDVIPGVANTHDISDNRVDEVVGRVTRAAYHMEIMPVQMNRVLLMEVMAFNLIISIVRLADTYRRIRGTTRNGQLNGLVGTEFVDASFRKEIRRFLRTTKDLK